MNSLNHLICRFGQIARFLPVFLIASLINVPASAEAGLDDSAQRCSPATRGIDQLFASGGTNHCPQAHAGINRPIELNQRVALDGSRTVDLDGQRLEFSWTVLRAPAGSAVGVENPDALKTHFTPDLAGDYLIELEVTDSMGGVSRDTVTFSTGNLPPVAHAGSDLTGEVGQLVYLDAERSYDFDNDVLAYQWTLIEQPSDSLATLVNPSASSSSLVMDTEGDYRIELKVKDRSHTSQGSELVLSTYNSAPVANAGRGRVVGPNSTIVFDSTRSSDFDLDALSYHWSVLSAPENYRGGFSNATTDSPSLKLGEAGQYLVQLVVDDGVAVSNPATAMIEVRADRLANFDLKDFLPLTNRNGGDDTDGDGVLDPVDNCVLIANAAQRDTDGDGIGNFCDPDLNNDGVVNFIDITLFTPLFLSTDDDADFNGDGIVNFLDYIIITNTFLQQPGPPGTIVWVSLVDGDFDDRLNWEPQIVPSAGTTAIIDVAPAVTVTQSGGSINVNNLVQNENLVLTGSVTFEATGALELGGTMTANNGTTVNNTQIVPSLAGTGTFSLNSGTHTWSSNTIGIPTTLNNSTLVNNNGGLTVNDTITLDAPSSPTGFQFLSDQTITGTGTIFMNGLGNSVINEPRLLPFNTFTLTLDSGITVRGGKGQIGQGGANVVVNGTVSADVSGEALRIQGATWSGTGSLLATNGGSIELLGTFDNGGNTLDLDTGGGSLQLFNGASLRNAILDGQPGTLMTVLGGTTTYENLQINADVTMVNSALTNVIGGLTLNGNMLIDAPSSPTGLQFIDTQTLGGNATIRFDGVGNTVIGEPRLLPFNGVTLTIAPTVDIEGGKGTIGQPAAALVLNGNVTADVDGEVIQILGSTWNSVSTLTAINNGGLWLGGNFDNGNNTLNLDTADGSINLLNGASLRNATITGTAGTELTVNSGSTNLEALTYTGDITMVNSAISNVTNGLTLNGTLLIDAPTSPTGLHLTGTQTLDGTATIIFDGVGNTVINEPRLLSLGTGTVLTIGEDITVRGGKGQIGQAATSLILLGDVIADIAGEEILMGGLDWSATGTLQSLNGGQIGLYGNMDNGGLPVTVDMAGGEFDMNNGTTLSNAVFNGTPGTELMIDTGTTGMTAMTFNHDLRHLNGAITNVAGGLTINGTSTVVAPVSPTGYHFNEAQTLGGTANIVLDSAGNSVINEPRLLPLGAAGDTLTIASTVTISGATGQIGQAARPIVMNGTVTANVSGEEILITGSNWSGTGNINAQNGGNIQLGGVLNNADMTLNFDTSGGTMNVLNGTQLRNTVMNGAAGTNFILNTGSFTFEDITFDADITHTNGAIATVTDGITVNGTVTVNAPTSPTGFHFANTQTLGGNANIVFNSAGNSVINEPRLLPLGGTLTIGSNVVVSGGVATIGSPSLPLVVDGRISADAGRIEVRGTSVTNNGVLEALGGQTLDVDNLFASPGDLHIGPGSIIDLVDAVSGLTAASDVMIDIGAGGSTGTLAAFNGGNAFAGTLTISAVDGYVPTVGEFFTLINQTDFAASEFDSVVSVGLGAGESFSVSYGEFSVTSTVTN